MGLHFSAVSVAPLPSDAMAEARRLRIPEFLVPSLPAGFSSQRRRSCASSTSRRAARWTAACSAGATSSPQSRCGRLRHLGGAKLSKIRTFLFSLRSCSSANNATKLIRTRRTCSSSSRSRSLCCPSRCKLKNVVNGETRNAYEHAFLGRALSLAPSLTFSFRRGSPGMGPMFLSGPCDRTQSWS
eukprot:SAG22_NODE_101_length_20519_cov_15.588002_9_plen_185_part_00